MTLVLVVGRDTHEPDPPTDLVVNELRRRHVPVLHLDPDEHPQIRTPTPGPARRSAVAAELSATDWTGHLRGSLIRHGDTNHDHRPVPLESITGIYYRRTAGHPDDPGLVAGDHRHTTADQDRLARTGLLLAAAGTRNRIWLNHPHCAAHAEYTAVQLHTAQAAGLHVPRTCLTDAPAVAARFVREASAVGGAVGGAIDKPVRGRGIADHEDDLAIDLVATYTPGYGNHPDGDYPGIDQPCPAPITVADCDDRIRTTVHLIQHRIRTHHQARLTIVDNRAFATRIDTATPDGHLHRPCAPTHLSYQRTTAPAPVQHAATQFLHHLGLRTATLDFVVDHHDRWWFLGANPHGGWVRAHHETGHPIAAALADALTGPAPAPVHELPGQGAAPSPSRRRASA